MTAKMSNETRLQTDLLGSFIAAFEQVKVDIVKLAHCYKACIEEGMDLGRWVKTKAHALQLLKIAEGKLLPELQPLLIAAPEAVTVTVVAVPLETQRQWLDEGVPVARGGKAVRVPIDELQHAEAKRLLDPVTKRILPPEEQAARMERPPAIVKHDTPVTLEFSREDYNDIAAQAKRAGQSIKVFLLAELVKAGVLRRDKKAA